MAYKLVERGEHKLIDVEEAPDGEIEQVTLTVKAMAIGSVIEEPEVYAKAGVHASYLVHREPDPLGKIILRASLITDAHFDRAIQGIEAAYAEADQRLHDVHIAACRKVREALED